MTADPRCVDLVDDDDDDGVSLEFAIDRHRKPYFGRSASKRSRVAVVGSISPRPAERLGRSGGMAARGLVDDDAMVDDSYLAS